MTPETTVDQWRSILSAHAAITCALERELQDGHGLSVSEFEVLERLVEGECRERRIQELADAVHLSQSATTRVVGRLEGHGLVRRAMCASDRRGVFAEVTPEGRERYDAARPTQRRVLGEHLAPVA
ncbi:MarR family winged helix-turn-helix transcriptional regulator [Patulibacter sp.]|uniref:MarR family winged helix-turn-helix transcriptional regulator n=1 Tax=Patulibacter sp. TaxID=1912859 RepID=UPI0027291FB3|nr:MarR family transcriptional regulator [Patulibacter sp.]MDO9409605.1 MarR family transcriptional regulator [Patulibacter sp.]